ncbi:MAG: DUF2490 domain-containing protein [Flavobacteriales bacterium]|nr:DUF2490 domain-containing protein [Flavobacteriales bacterium]
MGKCNWGLSIIRMSSLNFSFFIPFSRLPLKKIGIALAGLLLELGFASAQSIPLGTWNVVNINYRPAPRWNVLAEAGLRSLQFYNWYHFYEFKVAGLYRVAEPLRAGLGAGYYNTYGEGGNWVRPVNLTEVRIWPNLSIHQSIDRFLLDHRYRIELRFTSKGFRERYRYRFSIAYPWGRLRETGYRPFQVGLNNELFFSSRAPYFERTRMQFHINYKPSFLITLQAGYVFQFDYKIFDETGRDFLMLGLYFEIFRKKRPETRQAEPDNKDN